MQDQDNSNITITINIKGIDKLAEYAMSGMGSICAPLLPLIAEQKAKAKKITAEGEAKAKEIAAEGDAKAFLTSMKALTQVSEMTSDKGIGIEGESIEKEMYQQILFAVQKELKKELENVVSVVHKAADQLGDKEVPDQEPDQDWTSRFFDCVKDVSSDEMQVLWGKVLAGEIERPGSTSLRTLRILSDLDQKTAQLFRKFCSACVFLYSSNYAIVPSLGKEPGQNELEKYGLLYRVLLRLAEYGLILQEFTLQCNFQLHVGRSDMKGMNTKEISIKNLKVNDRRTVVTILYPFIFQGKYWLLKPIKEREWIYEKEFYVEGSLLTQAGLELSKVVDLEPMDDFSNDFSTFLQSHNLQMVETQNPNPHYFINCLD